MGENTGTSRFRATSGKITAVVAGLAIAALVVSLPTAARAETAPIDDTPVSVSTDSLPTAQIDGIVWTQKIVGNTVYAGGAFEKARPAGAAKGTQEVTRTNLIAYDIDTGVMTSWAPSINGQVRAIAASPDGSTLYIGGDFTSVNGQTRNRIAAFDLATKQLKSFAPDVNAAVRGIAVTDTAVYFTGTFGRVSGNDRGRAAAVTPTGALLPWAPVLGNGSGQAIVASPDGSKVVIGGSFTTLNGSSNPGYGLGIVDATSGALLPAPVNSIVRNGGSQAAILSLASDEDSFYGSGYVFGSGGNLEGVFRASWDTGALVWVEDCHGDTYNVVAAGDLIYETGHAHYCNSIVGGFPQSNPWTVYRGLAFTKEVERITPFGLNLGYYDWGGNPAPRLTHWFPTMDTGTVSGAGQGGWSVAANDKYVLFGGEFNRVNNKVQQGLARFTVTSNAPNTDGPRLSGANYVPTAQAVGAGAIRLSWPLNWDRDNEYLTYRLIRDGQNSSPIYEVTARSKPADWELPGLSFVDSGLAAGSSHTYRLRVHDPFGNVAWGDPITAVANGTGTSSAYSTVVQQDRPLNYWPLNDSSTTLSYDWGGAHDLKVNSGVTRGTAGALAGTTAAASSFNGSSNGFMTTTTRIAGPQSFGLEAWFKTTTTSGGKIIGFGDKTTGNSSNYDRHIYMVPNGRITFGVYPGSEQTVQSTQSYNDGQWHHVAAGLSSAGMVLYVDGVQVGSKPSVTSAQSYSGYWRIGGDSSWSGNNYFNGAIDEPAVYSAPLSASRVQAHYQMGKTGQMPNHEPVASFTTAVDKLAVSVDGTGSTDPDGTVQTYSWNWGDGSPASTGATATHTYAAAGDYTITLTVTDDKGATGTTTREVTTVANAAPVASFTSTVSPLKVAVNGSGSTDSDGTIASYSWSWGDGSPNGSGVSATHDYVAAGTYTVRLTVTDDDGGTHFVEKAVIIPPAPANVAPVAAFTSSTNGLKVTVNGTTSSDQDGTVESYSWSWGDDTPDGSGATATHTYAEDGEYTITLTVTDNDGATDTVSHTVEVAAPVGPTTYASDAFSRTVGNGLGTADTGGAWTFTNPASAYQADGSVARFTASAAGATRTAYLASVDSTDTSVQAEITLPQLPVGGSAYASVLARRVGSVDYRTQVVVNTAGKVTLQLRQTNTALAAVASGLTIGAGDTLVVRVEAVGTSPTALRAKVWLKGTAEPTAWLVTASDATAALQTGGYVGLSTNIAGTATNIPFVTVFDNFVARSSGDVTSPPAENVAPTASFTASIDGRTLSVDASASEDPDGTITAYAWEFGDGQSGTGKTATHEYAAPGNYTVTLTVTDNGGLTKSTTRSVTATNPAEPTDDIAADTFDRTASGAWGTATVGGAWTLAGGASNFSVADGQGRMSLAAGTTRSAYLSGVSATSANVVAKIGLPAVPTGSSVYTSVLARRVGAEDYRARAVITQTGTVQLQIQRTATTLVATAVSGLTVSNGDELMIRVETSGTAPTTIKAKVWKAGTTEPTAWNLTTTDATAGLQAAGAVGLAAYLGGSVTNVPFQVRFDDLLVVDPSA